MFYELAFIIVSRKPEALQSNASILMMMNAVDAYDGGELTHSSFRNESWC